MNILGLSVFCDASAAIIRNGTIFCAVEEERLNKIKHYEGFPTLAIRECLGISGLSFNDIDTIAVGWNPLLGLPNRIFHSLKSSFNSRKAFLSKIRRGKGYLHRCRELIFLKKHLSDQCGLKVTRQNIVFVDHHLAHAASAFFLSPWTEANVIVADGIGESTTVSFYHGFGKTLKRIRVIKFPHSLGHIYASVTKFLGFRMCYDEGKVMALSAFGSNIYAHLFNKLIKLNERKKTIIVDTALLDYHAARAGFFSKKWISATGLTPRKELEPITQKHKDLACSLQKRTEDVVFSLLKLSFDVREKPLCAAGGLFLNVVLNGKICRELNKDYFVQPAAGDNGVSIGSALYIASKKEPKFSNSPLKNIFFGQEYTETNIELALNSQKNHYYRATDVASETARFIAQGKIIEWYQGRMEFGPRALGNRSILANPLIKEMKNRVNCKVKHRELFRPFAASVLLEEGHKYFENFQSSPFMLKAFRIRKEFSQTFPAVTHIDASCRIQTVSRANSCYYTLLKEIKKRIGYGIVLNTSMNTRGQPIVNSPNEALTLFNTSDIDVIVMGNFVVTKTPNPSDNRQNRYADGPKQKN